MLSWFDTAPLYALGSLLLALMVLAFYGGHWLRGYESGYAPPGSRRARNTEYDGYIISAALGVLTILLGFTFSLVISRFEERRTLVVEQANVISTAYLRAQFLPSPHRERISRLLVQYTDNVIALAKAGPARSAPFLKKDDELLTDLWSATLAGAVTIKAYALSNLVVDSVNRIIDMDDARRSARTEHLPITVFAVLWIYLVSASGVLGYEVGPYRAGLSGFMLLLLTISYLLVTDIDRPTSGGVQESQAPLERLAAAFKQNPPSIYDRYRHVP